MELEKCESLRKLRFKSQQTHVDRLYVSLSLCRWNSNKPMVCCTNSPFPENALLGGEGFERPTKLNVVPPTSSTQFWITTRLPSRTTPLTRRPTSQLQEQKLDCSGVLDNRIYSGSETRIDELPFTAILSYSKSKF